MISSAQNYPASDIFGTEANLKYVVPKYQREYVWKKAEWAALFDDLTENAPGYFLGSIICIRQNDVDALQTQVLEVIDGQQRIATLSLLYAALYEWLGAHELDDDLKNERYNLRYRMIVKGKKAQLKLEPSFQQQNNQDYRAVLAQAGILATVNTSKNLGKRRIFKTYKYFQERLNELDSKGKPVFSVKGIHDLLKLINAASLVKIEVNSHSDAFTLFESLNNRGVPLTAMDIIKNKLLAVLEKNKKGSIDDNFEKWNRLLENLTDDPTVQQRFLRQYYNTFKIDKKVAVKSIPKATRSSLIRIYEKLIDSDAKWIFSELSIKSQLYNRLVNSDHEENGKDLKIHLRDLDRIGGAASYSLLMYLLSLNHIDSRDMIDIADFLVRFFVRRHLTDFPPTRDLDIIFTELIEHLNKKITDGPIRKRVRDYLTQPYLCSSDSDFKKELAGNIYEENIQVARFVLCKLEEEHQTKETRKDLWERDDKDRYVWTVEHIFPQGANIPRSWVNMIADGNDRKAKELQEEWVHKLGNLTLTGYNSKLGNMSFLDKRNRKDAKNRFVGYRNGLFLNEDLRSKSEWTIKDIKKRSNDLVNMAIKLFKL